MSTLTTFRPAGTTGQSTQAETVYAALSAAIMSGELPPGAKLSEPVLADQMGVSRAPVREAIRRLQERGIVVHVVNQGARVVSPTIGDFLDLFDVREALEATACRLAATTMTDAEITTLQDLLEQAGQTLRSDPEGPYLQSDYDTDFHVVIARGCGNAPLTDLLCDQFYPRLKLCRTQHQTVKGRGRKAWNEHRRITEAIVDRDGEAAEFFMRRHVRAAREALLAQGAQSRFNEPAAARVGKQAKAG